MVVLGGWAFFYERGTPVGPVRVLNFLYLQSRYASGYNFRRERPLGRARSGVSRVGCMSLPSHDFRREQRACDETAWCKVAAATWLQWCLAHQNTPPLRILLQVYA